MDLSIIIVNYNTAGLTMECVKSLLADSSGLSREIIIVDNASTDDSIRRLSALSKSRKNIHLIKNSENLGFSKANNKGMTIAKGKYILLLNSDTKVEPGAVDKLIRFAESKADAGAIVPRLLNTDQSIQPSCFRFPGIFNAVLEFWFGMKGRYQKYIPQGTSPSKVQAAVMAAFLITPKGRKKAGKLDESYFMYFEDLDYCRKLKRAGLAVYYLPSSHITHYHGGSAKKDANSWRKLIQSSKTYNGTLKYSLLSLIIRLGQKIPNFGYYILLTILTLPVILNLLRPGFFPMQDDLQAFRIYEMEQCIGDLQIPCRWVPDAGYQFGYPQFNYYPPSIYYLGAFFHRLGLQYIDSVKAIFILGYLLSAYGMFLLVSAISKKNFGALTGAILYTYVPYKAVEVYVRGAASEFWALVFFPFVFWASYLLIKRGKVRDLVFTAVSLALLATTHLLMTMIMAPAFAVWVLFWVIVEKKTKSLVHISLASFLGFGLAAFFVLPVIFERKFVHADSLLSGYFDYRQHFVNLKRLFVSMEWGYGSSGFEKEKLNLSVGVIQWILALVVAPLFAFNTILTNKRAKKLSFFILTFALFSLAVIFMIHVKSSFVWSKIPILAWLQFPWRFLTLVIFLLSLVSGVLVSRLGRSGVYLGIAAAFAAVVLYTPFFVPKYWLNISDRDKFSGIYWEKQLTISIFDYLPIYSYLPPINKAPAVPEVLEGEAEFVEYQKGSNFQTGLVTAESASVVRLPIFDFPGMQVRVDGDLVEHVNDDCRDQPFCYGLVTFVLPSGKHRVEVKLTNTPVRSAGNFLSVAAAVAGVLLILKFRDRRLL